MLWMSAGWWRYPVMASPIHDCEENEDLEIAIRKMIFSKLDRLFVYRNIPLNVVGVLSLSEAAELSSGSCQACVCSRIKFDGHGYS